MTRLMSWALLAMLAGAGCRRIEPQTLDPVRAIRSRVETRFRPPESGQITNAQIDLYLGIRRAAGAGSDAEAARAAGKDPAEFEWVRGRIVEAFQALDAKQVTLAAAEQYARSLAVLREVRRGLRAPQAAARIDAEIAALERERAALRKGDALAPQIARNAALVAPRRAEIASVGP
jgi:hypothetical protein